MYPEIEAYRKKVLDGLFKMGTFKKAWGTWQTQILNGVSPEGLDLIDLGNRLSSIFSSTGQEGRGQAELSGGGAAWEALVCWYLNIALVGTQTVVIKQKKELIPDVISDALTVMYGNYPSNTEADLVAITLPMKELDGKWVKDWSELCRENFEKVEICVIQCKTNWNDNAQIPMLWDMIYSSVGFTSRTRVGRNGYSIKDLKRFSYAFVTVPSNKKAKYDIKSTAILRVNALSGGNYWGKPTVHGVAQNISELINTNFSSSTQELEKPWPKSFQVNLQNKPDLYSYFGLSI